MRRRSVCSYQIFFVPKFNACRMILAAVKVRVTRRGRRNILPRKRLWKEVLEKMNWFWLDSYNRKSSLYHLIFPGFSLETVTHYHLQEYRKGWMDKYGSRAHRRWTIADTVSVWRNPFQPLLNVCEYMLPFLTFYNCGSVQELVAVASGSLPCPRRVPASTEIFLSLKSNKWPVEDKRLAPWPAEEQIYMHLILESAHRSKGTFSWLLFSWAASIVPAMVSPTTTCSESHCKNPYLRILL